MNYIVVPAINTLKSTDAVAIREITFTLIKEITELRKELEDMKNMQNEKSRRSANK
jgi:hypothetical protein